MNAAGGADKRVRPELSKGARRSVLMATTGVFNTSNEGKKLQGISVGRR